MDISHGGETFPHTSALDVISDLQTTRGPFHADSSPPVVSNVSNINHRCLQTVLYPASKDSDIVPELLQSDSSIVSPCDVKTDATPATISVFVGPGSEPQLTGSVFQPSGSNHMKPLTHSSKPLTTESDSSTIQHLTDSKAVKSEFHLVTIKSECVPSVSRFALSEPQPMSCDAQPLISDTHSTTSLPQCVGPEHHQSGSVTLEFSEPQPTSSQPASSGLCQVDTSVPPESTASESGQLETSESARLGASESDQLGTSESAQLGTSESAQLGTSESSQPTASASSQIMVSESSPSTALEPSHPTVSTSLEPMASESSQPMASELSHSTASMTSQPTASGSSQPIIAESSQLETAEPQATTSKHQPNIGASSTRTGACSSPDLTDNESDSDGPMRTKRLDVFHGVYLFM